MGALLAPAFPLAAFSLLGFFVAYYNDNEPVRVGGRVTVDEKGLARDGVLVVPRSAIGQGVVTKRSDRTVLRLHRKGSRSTITVEVPNEAEGKTMLHALGLDASQHVSEMRAASQLLAWSAKKQLFTLLAPILLGFFPLAMVSMTLGIRGIPFAAVCYLSLFAFVFGISFHPTQVQIGVDGVATRWFGRERFVSFSDVKNVERYEQHSGGKTYLGVELALEDGSTVRIPTGQEGLVSRTPDALLARIREGLELHRERRGAAVDPALFARRGRDGRAWVAGLRSLGSEAAEDLRRASISADRLLDVLDDASATATARVGAAVAALASSREAAMPRLRAAASTTASPRLRVALERVEKAGEDDAALVEALAEAENEEAEASLLPRA